VFRLRGDRTVYQMLVKSNMTDYNDLKVENLGTFPTLIFRISGF